MTLYHWLRAVPERVIPVTHPSERQALADLLAQLELCVTEPTTTSLEEAHAALLVNAGDWVNTGAVYDAGNH